MFKLIWVPLVLALIVWAGPAAAQSASEAAIIEALAPKKPLTRSFRKPDPKAELRQRGIRIDQPLEDLDELDVQRHDIVIHFHFDSDEPTAEGWMALDSLGRALRHARMDGVVLQVAGHTDATGAAGYNLALSQRRAEAVVRHLISRHGVPPSDLLPIAYGETRPLPHASDDSASLRRVELISLNSYAAALAAK
ncbi:MAG: OmpA family protein [Pseudomonadota bacterium]